MSSFNYFYEMSGNHEPDVSTAQNMLNVQAYPPIPGGDYSCDEAPDVIDPDYPDTQDALFRIAEQDSTYALIHFLADSLPDKQWNRVEVGVALKADTTSWARSILDSIPKDNADDSTFYDYYDLAISLKEDTLTWFDVDSTQRSLVDNIASGTSSVKYRAEAVQMLLDDTVYVRIPEQVPQEPSGKWAGEEEPNPTERC